MSEVKNKSASYMDVNEGQNAISRSPVALNELPDNPAIMMASLHVVFPTQLAAYWRSQGLDVVIVTEEPNLTGRLPDGTFVLSLSDYEPGILQKVRSLVGRLLRKIETLLIDIIKPKVSGYSSYLENYVISRVAISMMLNISMASFVRKLNPRFVFGHQVYRTGFALSRLRDFPTAIMPYGQDIYLFASTAPLAHWYTRYSLRRIKLICPSSSTASKYIKREFHVDECKLFPVSWGVDTGSFHPAGPLINKELRSKYTIPLSATVITNVRRFAPAWGSDVILEAFIQLARHDINYHFILFSGNRQSVELAQARKVIEAEGLLHRFTMFEESVSLKQFAEILSITDIFTSMMIDQDMRSASILQATASGGVPVLSDQEEYRKMESLGFKALFVDSLNTEGIVSSVKMYMNDQTLRDETKRANTQYIDTYENYERQMDALLGRIRGLTA